MQYNLHYPYIHVTWYRFCMNRFDLTTPIDFLYYGTRSIFSSRNIEYPSLKKWDETDSGYQTACDWFERWWWDQTTPCLCWRSICLALCIVTNDSVGDVAYTSRTLFVFKYGKDIK